MVNSIPWLSILWLTPAVGAIAALLPAPGRRRLANMIALGASLLALAVVVVLLTQFDPGGEQYQFVESHTWIPSFGAGYVLGVDGIALTLVVLTAVLVPLLIIAGWNDADGRGRSANTYVALILGVEAMVLISLTALDVLLFYVFFEAMLIPMYLLIGRYGSDRAPAAAVKFLLYSLFGGLIMLVAVIGLYVTTSTTGDSATFDIRHLVAATSSVNPALLDAMFFGFMIAFSIKAPMWPFHTWLPGVAEHSKPTTTVLMMAVVDKVGTFGMLRYCLQLFPDSAQRYAPVIIGFAVVSIVYSAIVAVGQKDMMRLIAYASVSHYGFIILGIFAMTTQGQSGSTLYMLNHGIATAALFLIAGFLVSRRGSRMIVDYGGVQQVAPILAGTFLIAGLASLALPGLAPFVSEFLVLIGTFTHYPLAAICASTALVLSAVYILWTYQRIMTGPARTGGDKITDLVPRELAVVTPLIAILLVLGTYPKIALDVINPAVGHTLTTLGGETPEGPQR